MKYKNIEKKTYNTKTHLNVKKEDKHIQKAEGSHLISGLNPKAAKSKFLYLQKKKVLSIGNIYDLKLTQKVLNYSHKENTQIFIFYIYLQQVMFVAGKAGAVIRALNSNTATSTFQAYHSQNLSTKTALSVHLTPLNKLHRQHQFHRRWYTSPHGSVAKVE